MLTWISGTVDDIIQGWNGSEELRVTTPDGTRKALAYPELVGHAQPGWRVIMSGDATRLNLGTGGYLFVVAYPDHLPVAEDKPGHLMKARYTPLQLAVQGVDEQDTAYHSVLENADSIDGMPVVIADLHSALPAIVTGIRMHEANARITYVYTDTAALPVWFSRLVSTMSDRQDLQSVITTGQAFGGDHEAVNVHTGLLAARHVDNADFAIVIQGPGNLGTGTRWGFSGTVAGDHINAVNALGGHAIGTLRVSGGDQRGRHYGLSHHTVTAYTRVALSPVTVPTTQGIEASLLQTVDEELAPLRECPHISLVDVDTTELAHELAASPYHLSTMGRTYDDDPAPFIFAGAGGLVAGR